MKILVLGGTRFLGRAIVRAALGRGHDVTVLNRGQTAPDLFPGVPRLLADRGGDLSILSGQRWHAVIDVAGYDPQVVRRSVQALHGAVERYVFVSTVSVYADHSGRQVEGQPVLQLRDGLPAGDLYGARKAAAESVVSQAYRDTALIVRPGLIVGPHDPTDRFAYWPRCVARGGAVLAPGHPDDPAQLIDARDLADWIVTATGRGIGGVFNATGETITMAALLGTCLDAVTASTAELVWVDTDRLLAAGADPWMGVPLWIAAPGWSGANHVDITRAKAAGLTFRPLAETVRDTLAWDRARGGPAPGAEAMTPEYERQLLIA